MCPIFFWIGNWNLLEADYLERDKSKIPQSTSCPQFLQHFLRTRSLKVGQMARDVSSDSLYYFRLKDWSESEKWIREVELLSENDSDEEYFSSRKFYFSRL